MLESSGTYLATLFFLMVLILSLFPSECSISFSTCSGVTPVVKRRAPLVSGVSIPRSGSADHPTASVDTDAPLPGPIAPVRAPAEPSHSLDEVPGDALPGSEVLDTSESREIALTIPSSLDAPLVGCQVDPADTDCGRGAMVVFTRGDFARPSISVCSNEVPLAPLFSASVEDLLSELCSSVFPLFSAKGKGPLLALNDIESDPYSGEHASDRVVRFLVQSFHSSLSNLLPAAMEDHAAYKAVVPALQGAIEGVRARGDDLATNRLQAVLGYLDGCFTRLTFLMSLDVMAVAAELVEKKQKEITAYRERLRSSEVAELEAAARYDLLAKSAVVEVVRLLGGIMGIDEELARLRLQRAVLMMLRGQANQRRMAMEAEVEAALARAERL